MPHKSNPTPRSVDCRPRAGAGTPAGARAPAGDALPAGAAPPAGDALSAGDALPAGGQVLRRVCVYAGARNGHREAFAGAARELGRLLARRGVEIVYGGGGAGLMGALADAALGAGGRVVGVIPAHLVEREVAHRGLSELLIVGSMHERKAEMAVRAQAFIALPGGTGTLEELVEMLTWAQLGLHDKPIGLLNVEGYYRHLLAFLDVAVAEGLLAPEHRRWLSVATTAGELLALLAQRAGRAPSDPPRSPYI